MQILFISANRLGDAVLSTGLLDHLVRTWPAARLTIAAGSLPAPLFRAVPGLERLIPFDKRPGGGHWWRLWRQTVGTAWDMVIDLRDSPLPWLLYTRRRIIHRDPRGRRRGLVHKVVAMGRLLDLEPAPAPRLWLDLAAERRALELIPPGAPVLALGPAANWAAKTWRPERFAALAAWLTHPDGLIPDARLAVLGGAGERDQVGAVLEAVPAERVIDLVGRVDPLEAAACLARASLYVGNDSGLMHIAAAMGTPTLGLFGPGWPEIYAPWGPHTAWIAGTRSRDEILESLGRDHLHAPTQMDSLTVEAVVEAARQLWHEAHHGHGPARP